MSSQNPLTRPNRSTLFASDPDSTVSRRAALRGMGALSATLLLAAASRPASADSQSDTAGAPLSVVGAWDLAFRGAAGERGGAGGPDRALATFTAEGGFRADLTPGWRTDAGPFRFHGGGHGSWRTKEGGVVEAGYTVLTYDETGACDGARRITLRASIDGKAVMTGTYLTRIYDADGAMIDLVSGAVEGVIAG